MRIALYVASVTGLAMLARTLLVGPLPTWLALAAFLGYVALAISGWVFPSWEMYGDVFWRGSGSQPLVALTFDDGPSSQTTPMVLDELARQGLTAAFCVIGAKAEKHPDLVRRMAKEGHHVVMHGYEHARLYAWQSPKAIAADIERCRKLIEQLTGTAPRWFRPPIGHVSPRVVAGAQRAGVSILGFSARGLDGLRGATPESVLSRIAAKVGPGAIIVLHDTSELDSFVPAGIEVLRDLGQLLRDRGLRAVSIDELWRHSERYDGSLG